MDQRADLFETLGVRQDPAVSSSSAARRGSKGPGVSGGYSHPHAPAVAHATEVARAPRGNHAHQEEQDPMVRRELARLRTGEDAITFFTKTCGTSSTKVLYCNRVAVTGRGAAAHPYNLVV